jgi:uncharacterized protein (TIGR03084 family)
VSDDKGHQDLDEVRRDLVAEQEALDLIVAALEPGQWSLPTPSPGWDITDQLGHLTFFDGTAALAISDPDAFAAGARVLFTAGTDESIGFDQFTLGSFRELSRADRLEAWRGNRRILADAAATLVPGRRVAWYGPSMGASSFVTARLMEVWAHGTDIVDTVGAVREPTDRLRHIAQLGFITRKWSYTVRGEDVPEGDVRVELEAPSGARWAFGPEEAADVVAGSAEDFCLVVTQRRHVDDTDLVAGELGRHWLLRAQAFAGGPTNPPARRR